MERRKGNLEHLNVEVTPQEAKEKLRAIGLKEESWMDLGRQHSFGSHTLKALLRIAIGERTRNLLELYLDERDKDTS